MLVFLLYTLCRSHKYYKVFSLSNNDKLVNSTARLNPAKRNKINQLTDSYHRFHLKNNLNFMNPPI